MTPPLPDLALYTRPGCGLCHETRAFLLDLLAARGAAGLAAPTLLERDIEPDPELSARYGAAIPVLELGASRLELATSPGGIRRWLQAAVDALGDTATDTDPDAAQVRAPA